MTSSQKVYTAIVILFGLFLLFALGVFYFLVLPRQAEAETIKLSMFVFAFYAAIFFVTAGVNIAKNRLSTLPTVIQAVMLLFTLYGLPFGIWGIALLREECRRSAESKPTGAIGTSGDIIPECD